MTRNFSQHFHDAIIKMNFTGQRWVVLGAGGFIGTNLCVRLVQNGANVVAFGRSLGFARALTGCQWVVGDFFNPRDLANILEGADIVVHALSTVTPAKSNESPINDIEENLIGTLRLLELCKTKGVARLVFLSSGGTVYGPDVSVPTVEDEANEPICSYGVVKLAIEKYLAIYRQQQQLDSVVLRVANPFGPYQLPKGQGVIAATIQKVLMGQPPEIWGDGNVVRDYIYIDDVIDAILAAAQLDGSQAPRLYNIGSGVGKSLNEVVNGIAEIHGAIHIKRLPGRAVDVPVSILNIQRAERFLNWRPHTDWKLGLRLTYSWFERFGLFNA
ncbi:NAD-dependent epimerase/dehydratase family protein [Methylovulum sp.]|uniref:NAD-dependent epimerase/dehydratase family protein n=1 Tax=Methylovulum sp. TaxID=1916980 RepID=UPI0026297249|nr:NAD-dependent epimerase/dehydratase family protein [Methylovulum sp.]MDD5123591.1 NAD-dependent epimerase/dehydratase family protein [Methylovulum sp.]